MNYRYRINEGGVVIREPNAKVNHILPYLINCDELNINTIQNLLKKINNFPSALFIASPTLYTSVKNTIGDTEKVVSSFFKYLIRFSTRPTPFGLFSSTLVTSEHSLIVNKPKIRSLIRVNDGWLTAIINNLQTDEDNLFKLSIRRNKSLQITNNKVKNFFYINRHQRINSTKTIKLNALICSILDLGSNEFTPIKNIYDEISKNLVVDKHEFSNLVIMLIEYGFILTNLYKEIDNPMVGLELLLFKCNNLNLNYSEQLKDITYQLKMINSPSEKIPQQKLQCLVDNMSKIKYSERYIDCISIKDNPDGKINIKKDIDKLEEFVDFISKVSEHIYNDTHKEASVYTNLFIETYGFHREVPILDLIDETSGLGLPKELEDGFNKSELVERLEKLILDKSIEQKEININSTFFQEIKNSIDETNLNDTSLTNELFIMDCYSNLKTPFDEIINVGPVVATQQAGKTIGRFIDGLDKKNKNIVINENKLLQQKHHLQNEELVTLITDFANPNILNLVPEESQSSVTCPIGINFNTKKKILSLNDIVVGINSQQKLYFRSLSLKKYIKFSSFSNLNSFMGNKLYNFLISQSEDIPSMYLIMLINSLLEKVNKKPAIVFNQVVIQPKSLRIDKKNLSKEELHKDIGSYFNDSLIYIKENDNRLLINIENPQLFHMLYDMYKKKGKIILCDVEKKLKFLLKKERTDIKIVELVYPLWNVQKKEKSVTSAKYLVQKKNQIRTFSPFSEWTQINIYTKHESQFFFLVHLLKPFLNETFRSCELQQFFFIRYSDAKGPHIRLRVHATNMNPTTFFPHLSTFLTKMIDQKYISGYAFQAYEREIERYGDYSTIMPAENYFVSNSLQSLEILSSSEDLNLLMPIMIYHLINHFNVKMEIIEQIMKKNRLHEHSKEYRKYKKKLFLYFEESFIEGTTINKIATSSKNAVESYKKSIILSDNCNEDNEIDILFSLIHMFCNRVFDIDRNMEKKIVEFTRGLINYSIRAGKG